MEFAKSQATQILTGLGFQVDEIPTGDSRRADLRVYDDSFSYHLEVKEKFESAEDAMVRADLLRQGEIYQQADLLAHDNRISGIFRYAQKQLDETPKDSSTFQLIWFHANGIDADLKYRQAFATFYGQVQLIAIPPLRSPVPVAVESRPPTPHCFYFDYSAAFAMPTVEALIITDSETMQVCLNEFSSRANEFRSTPFCQKFAELDGVIDPKALVAAGKIIACRTDAPRKNDNDIAKALQEQTGVLYTPIRLTRHACSAAVQPQGRKRREQSAE